MYVSRPAADHTTSHYTTSTSDMQQYYMYALRTRYKRDYAAKRTVRVFVPVRLLVTAAEAVLEPVVAGVGVRVDVSPAERNGMLDDGVNVAVDDAVATGVPIAVAERVDAEDAEIETEDVGVATAVVVFVDAADRVRVLDGRGVCVAVAVAETLTVAELDCELLTLDDGDGLLVDVAGHVTDELEVVVALAATDAVGVVVRLVRCVCVDVRVACAVMVPVPVSEPDDDGEAEDDADEECVADDVTGGVALRDPVGVGVLHAIEFDFAIRVYGDGSARWSTEMARSALIDQGVHLFKHKRRA